MSDITYEDWLKRAEAVLEDWDSRDQSDDSWQSELLFSISVTKTLIFCLEDSGINPGSVLIKSSYFNFKSNNLAAMADFAYSVRYNFKTSLFLEKAKNVMEWLRYSIREIEDEGNHHERLIKTTPKLTEWGPNRGQDIFRWQCVEIARASAELAASILYKKYGADEVYCFGSLVRSGGEGFEFQHDIDLIYSGIPSESFPEAWWEIEEDVSEVYDNHSPFDLHDIVNLSRPIEQLEFHYFPLGEIVKKFGG